MNIWYKIWIYDFLISVLDVLLVWYEGLVWGYLFNYVYGDKCLVYCFDKNDECDVFV